MKIRKGDEVKILSGKDNGKTGKVVKVFPKTDQVVVEGLNLRKKHARSRQAEKKGEVVLIPAPVAVSKVQLVCPHCSKVTRVRYEIGADTKAKARICKKCGQSV